MALVAAIAGVSAGAIVGFAGAALSVAAAATSAALSIQAANQQAKTASEEAEHLFAQANLARAQAATEAAQRERAARRRLGEAAAGFASSGIAGTGTVLDVLGDIAFEEELGVALTLQAGEQRAISLLSSATLTRFEAKQAQQRARIQATATLVGSIGGTATSLLGSGAGVGGGGTS